MSAYAWLETLVLAAALAGSLLWLLNRYAPGLVARLRRKPLPLAQASGCGSACSGCDTGCARPKRNEQPIRLHR